MKKEVLLILLILTAVLAFAQENQTKELQQVKKDLEEAAAKIKVLESRMTSQIKKEQSMPKALFVFYLLAINLVLLVFVIILLFYFYRKYIFKRYGIGEIHPVPKELVYYVYKAISAGNKLSNIRMDLAKKGWEPSMIEHAIDAAKEMG